MRLRAYEIYGNGMVSYENLNAPVNNRVDSISPNLDGLKEKLTRTSGAPCLDASHCTKTRGDK